MKKFLSALSLIIGLGFATAQQTAPATTQKAAPHKTAKSAKPVKPAPAVKLKADGTPDKRYKTSQHLKKDGTVDKRYKTSK